MTHKRWPSDAVMVVASLAGRENREEMESVVEANCRDCGKLLHADSYTIHRAHKLPCRLGRPVKFFCTDCYTNYDVRTITDFHNHSAAIGPIIE